MKSETKIINCLAMTAALVVCGVMVRGLLSDGFGVAIMACSLPFAISALCVSVKGVVK